MFFSLLNPYYLSRDDHNRKIRTGKQRTNVGKDSFVNRIIKNWNTLPAGLLASFPCKLNTFRKRVKNVVRRKKIQVGTECKYVK
jgi:hypothetical protein